MVLCNEQDWLSCHHSHKHQHQWIDPWLGWGENMLGLANVRAENSALIGIGWTCQKLNKVSVFAYIDCSVLSCGVCDLKCFFMSTLSLAGRDPASTCRPQGISPTTSVSFTRWTAAPRNGSGSGKGFVCFECNLQGRAHCSREQHRQLTYPPDHTDN